MRDAHRVNLWGPLGIFGAMVCRPPVSPWRGRGGLHCHFPFGVCFENMIVIVGCIVVIGAVLGGFTMAGGHVGALIHVSEIVTIGGAALGALIVSAPKKVLIDMMKGIVSTLKGSPFGLQAYQEALMCLYDLFRLARRDGLLALESHVGNPHESSVISKYPKVHGNHHLVSFITGGLAPMVEATTTPEQLEDLLAAEIRIMEEEHHLPVAALQKTADALPGFGIVAAVLGIVITMSHIDGPPAEIGHKVGAALVGTFLGILMSYGFAAPLATRLELLGHSEAAFFRTVATALTAFAKNMPPKVAIELARRSIESEFRPDREQLDTWFQDAEALAA